MVTQTDAQMDGWPNDPKHVLLFAYCWQGEANNVACQHSAAYLTGSLRCSIN